MNLHPLAKKSYVALAIFLALPTAAAWAQGGGAAATTPTKIAVLNVQEAIAATDEGKQAAAQFQAQFTPEQNELDSMQKQMGDIQSRLANGTRTLSDDAKAQLQRQGQMLQREYQRKQDDLQDQVTSAQTDILDQIGRKMMDVLDKYSKDKGIGVILDSSAQGTPVVYGSPQLDITQDIIRLYDQEYPVKAASAPAAAPAPGAPKPATPAAPKPATPATPPAPAR